MQKVTLAAARQPLCEDALGSWQCSVSLSLSQDLSVSVSLCLSVYVSFSVSLGLPSVSGLYLSLTRTPVTGPRPTQIQSGLNDICKGPFTKQVPVHRFQGPRLWGVTIQPTTGTHLEAPANTTTDPGKMLNRPGAQSKK